MSILAGQFGNEYQAHPEGNGNSQQWNQNWGYQASDQYPGYDMYGNYVGYSNPNETQNYQYQAAPPQAQYPPEAYGQSQYAPAYQYPGQDPNLGYQQNPAPQASNPLPQTTWAQPQEMQVLVHALLEFIHANPKMKSFKLQESPDHSQAQNSCTIHEANLSNSPHLQTLNSICKHCVSNPCCTTHSF